MRQYADHAATTPLCQPARDAVASALDRFGNPSSLHQEGRRAKDLIDSAREIVSAKLGCLFAEVIFTSGGTEAANLALIGLALANEDSRRTRILLSAAEHHCVLHTQPLLERLGYQVELVPVDACARTDLDVLATLLDDGVLVVAAMHANNEVGSIQDMSPIANLCHKHGAKLFCDAVQTFCTLPFEVDDIQADLVSISAHKVNGPVGAGALFVRGGTKVAPIMVGGTQERELRAGTENVPAIAGFGAAVLWREAQAVSSFVRDNFVKTLGAEWIPTLPKEVACLPGHAHGRYPGVAAETYLIKLDRQGIAASSGAACSSGSIDPSHVLLAMGWSESQAREGLRFSLPVTSELASSSSSSRLQS